MTDNLSEKSKAKRKDLIKIDPKPYKRWYERNKHMNTSVKLLCEFTPPVNNIMLVIFNRAVQIEMNSSTEKRDIQSIGQEKIMGLFNSKKKRRSYDTDPILHQIMNYYSMLSTQKQDFMTLKVLQTVKLMHLYLEQFVTINHDAELEEIVAIAKDYLAEETPQTKAFCADLKSFLTKSLKQSYRKIEPELAHSKLTFLSNAKEEIPASKEHIIRDQIGLHIKGR
ncbi:MAG: hypothetical protein AAGI66_08720 [Cyanobacteria bacterium P01_H01_bin.74]